MRKLAKYFGASLLANSVSSRKRSTYTFPMIIYTLFDALDFLRKEIAPFNTHMGSGDGGTYKTIRELEPNATVLEGLALSMKDAEGEPSKKIETWLSKINAKR